MTHSNFNTTASISEKLNQLKISQVEKDIIIENGLRYRILESENELKKIKREIKKLENLFGNSFEELEKEGLSNNADYEIHERYMDLKALIYDRLEIQKKIGILNKLFESES